MSTIRVNTLVNQSGTDISLNANLIVTGDLTVIGDNFTATVTDLSVTDQNITVNNGGNDATSEGAGLTVFRTGTFGSLIYANALASKWACGDLGSESEIVTVGTVQTITEAKTFSALVTASNGLNVTGYLGVGVVPVEILHLKEDHNDNTRFRIDNVNTGSNANVGIEFTTDSTTARIFKKSLAGGDEFVLRNNVGVIIEGTGVANRAFQSTAAGAVTLGPVSGLGHTVNGNLALTLTSTTGSGTLNNFNLGTDSIKRFTSGSTKTITGFTGGVDGRLAYLINTGANLTFNNEDAGSTAENRIVTGSGAAVTITGDGGATLIYVAGRWRIVGINI